MDASLFNAVKLPGEQTFGEWLSLELQPMPIRGWVILKCKQWPIDHTANCGEIIGILWPDHSVSEVHDMTRALGLFGIATHWSGGLTYVATVN